mmetsp:Transcript_38486/g.80635  ORF Transcript_38486/g.80635 Transcript_38486/m.80635 type:complete len:488 (+) Transcript_38486:54-1517(+)
MTMTSSSNEIYLAAIEGGGTTFVVSVARVVPLHEAIATPTAATGNNNNGILQIGPTTLQILHTTTIPSPENATSTSNNSTPARILDETCAFLRRHLPSDNGKYSAVGIATFGPAGVNPTRTKDYGTILAGSPKREWRGVDLLTPIARACGLGDDGGGGKRVAVVGFDTDVNAPALAEFRHRRYLQEQQQQQKRRTRQSPSPDNNNDDKPLTSLSYVTIGTGVGVGLVLNSQPIHGLLHPEGGHVAIRPLEGDAFAGYSWGAERSPYGGVGTVEGVTSSVALTERLLQMEEEEDGVGGDYAAITTTTTTTTDARKREVLATLPDDHPVWNHASNAIANLCVSLLLLTSCQKIVLGGGIMKRGILYDMVRRRAWTLLNGYLDSVEELSSEERLKDVIVEGSWEEVGSGLVGAFALALDAYESGNGDGEDMNGDDKEESIDVPAVQESSAKQEEEEKRQQSFTSGVLAGIGLSFGCALLSSLLGHGRPRR